MNRRIGWTVLCIVALAAAGFSTAHSRGVSGVEEAGGARSTLSPLLSETALHEGGDASPIPELLGAEGEPLADCNDCGTIFYGGDADGRNALASEQNATIADAWTFDDFDHPGGQITALWGNFLTNYTALSGVKYEIRKDMKPNDCGTLVAAGALANLAVCITGRTSFGYQERLIRGDVSLNLPAGRYFLALAPVQTPAGRAFIATTSGTDLGPATDPNPKPTGTPLANGNSFFRSVTFGANCVPTTDVLGPGTWDFSYGVCGVPAQQTHPCHWWQPWNKRRPSYESRVVSCQQPNPLQRIALDDFVCCDDSKIKQIQWWGWLRDPAQGKRPFYIAIYLDNGNCGPMTSPVYRICIEPNVAQRAGIDCQNRRIYRLAATLPAAFNAAAGQRYWLQISEADAESVQPGVEDFRWSAHRPCDPPACWAVQGVPYAPLPPDACDQKRNELAFALNSRSLYVRLPGTLAPHNIGFSYELVDGTGVVEYGHLMLDDNGQGTIHPEVEDGAYELILYTTGDEAVREPVRLLDGEEFMVNLRPLCIADSNLDGAGNFADINKFVECLSK